ncbi:hypothetical protein [Silvimonas amylolytica]|uniref:SprA-related family protein n=1 Tax=Silvimonas amylolytica TaxID=449663 RepID=A0ABQ2PM48_9NEIS|nr:hypothetical protein [Silvimonas amylolytica]GGP26682.1 hypothetical protein GCM10010971_25010 [Silvimonas amylolytica]
MANAPVSPLSSSFASSPIMANSVRSALAADAADQNGGGNPNQARAALEEALLRAHPDGGGHHGQRDAHAPERPPPEEEYAQNQDEVVSTASEPASGDSPYHHLMIEPDGARSVIFGHRKVNLRKGRTPEETLRTARIIMATSLAPESPSPEELSAAEEAQKLEDEAMEEINARQTVAARQLSAYQPPDLPAVSDFEETA